MSETIGHQDRHDVAVAHSAPAVSRLFLAALGDAYAGNTNPGWRLRGCRPLPVVDTTEDNRSLARNGVHVEMVRRSLDRTQTRARASGRRVTILHRRADIGDSFSFVDGGQ